MKYATLTTATALAALLTSVTFAAADISVVDGCAVVKVEGTNYYNKADPNCAFGQTATQQTGTIYRLVDTDLDPTTPAVSVAFEGNKG
jgi:hypothetical protein